MNLSEYLQQLQEVSQSFSDFDLQSIVNDGEFKPASKTRMIIKTDEDRLKVMSNITKAYPDFKRDTSIKGSSIGGIKNNNLTIIVKPKTKVKGGGGRAFENEFIAEFAKWCEDTSVPSIYGHLFEGICSENNITAEDLSKFVTKPMGKLNQKRTLQDILKTNADIGSTVTDIDLETADKMLHLSLKIGPSFYLYNGGFKKILDNAEQRRTILANFGIDYKKFELDFHIAHTATEFEPKEVNDAEAKKNLESFISNCLGYGYTMVHENGAKSTVLNLTTKQKIKIVDMSYRYRSEKAKYFAIDMTVIMLGKKYKVQFQLRNNAGGMSPNVIYILVGKEGEMSKEEHNRINESEMSINALEYLRMLMEKK